MMGTTYKHHHPQYPHNQIHHHSEIQFSVSITFTTHSNTHRVICDSKQLGYDATDADCTVQTANIVVPPTESSTESSGKGVDRMTSMLSSSFCQSVQVILSHLTG